MRSERKNCARSNIFLPHISSLSSLDRLGAKYRELVQILDGIFKISSAIFYKLSKNGNCPIFGLLSSILVRARKMDAINAIK